MNILHRAPFTIATKAGKRFRINHELHLDIAKNPARVAILDSAGMIYVLERGEICGVSELV